MIVIGILFDNHHFTHPEVVLKNREIQRELERD
jgi:hypothetical protein